jgi:type I restriction-modification system DNA methylase subunit
MTKKSNYLFSSKIINNKIEEIEIPQDALENFSKNILSLEESAITMGKPKGNEENVRVKVVVPILEFLGFDKVHDIDFEKFSKSKGSSSKSIDIWIKSSKGANALVEVKYWKKDLDKFREDRGNRYRSDAQQGLIYAMENGIEWFIITNGFLWRLYKTHISGHVTYNFYEEFTWDTLKEIQTLKKFYLLFSKTSFDKNLQDTLFYKTELEKEKLNDDIYAILTDCRSRLFKDVFPKNKSILNEKTLLEKGQKLLDRFIFIRFAEDNKLFPRNILEEFVNKWKSQPMIVKKTTPLYVYIKALFDSIYNGSKDDEIFAYNGGLFAEDEILEKIKIDNDVLMHVIDQIYKYPNGMQIDFSEIPVDILGHIYEKYLGLTLMIREEGAELILKEATTKIKRKKTGIYYTPKYIVNFINEHTIMRKLEENIDILPNLKILDPACGSGAFLSGAYDILLLSYKEYNEIVLRKGLKKEKTIEKTKKNLHGKETMNIAALTRELKNLKVNIDTRILSDNLYGVDLNPESVEITKMSLWFKTAQKNVKLNSLEDRIKCGDSLIEENTLSDFAFKWEEKFKEVFKMGGFDIIIGNPPYFKIQKGNPLQNIDDYKEVRIAGVNAASVFINKSLRLLKENGILGFIVPKQLTYTRAWDKIREKLLHNTTINFLIDCHKAFKGVLLEQVIFIIEKKQPLSNHTIKIGNIEENQIKITGEITQSLCKTDNKIYLDYNSTIHGIRTKIESQSVNLRKIAHVQGGVGVNHLQKKEGVFHTNKIKESDLIVIKGNDIQRYYLRDRFYFDPKDPLIQKYNARIENPPKKKIVVQRIIAHIRDHIKITASIDEESSIVYDTVLNIFPNEENDLYLILGILNSRLISYYIYKFIYNNAIRSMDFTSGYASLTPILKATKDQNHEVTKIVKELTKLNYQLLEYNDKVQLLFNKYSGAIKTKIVSILNENFNKLLVKKDKKEEIKDIHVEIDGDMIFISIKNKKFLKLQISDSNKRKYLSYYLDTIPCDKLKQEKTKLATLKGITIDDFTDIQAINRVCQELDKIPTKSELKAKIRALEGELNKNIYQYYDLTQKEIDYIEKSFE